MVIVKKNEKVLKTSEKCFDDGMKDMKQWITDNNYTLVEIGFDKSDNMVLFVQGGKKEKCYE